MSNVMKVTKVPIELDKERNLAFDLNAFCALEEIYGSQQKAVDALSKNSIKAIRAFLWAGLIHEDEALTEKQVGAMISATDVQFVAEKLLLAVSGNLPESKN